MKISKLQLVYLAALSMLGFVATDMYLPAFKAMEIDFATGPEQIALSLTVFLVGMAFGQLMWGLASDKFGHRNTLAAGLVLFTIASFGLAFCDEVWQLLTLRFVQAIGVCAPAVIWQAMVIKRYSSSSQQIFATIMPLVALSPALAPQLGVVLADSFGWHSIFIALTLVGVVLVAATMAQKNEQAEIKQTSMSADIKALLGSKTYLGNVFMFATASAAFFAYLTGMPEIMSQLGYEAKDIGLSFIPQTIAFMVGGYLGKVGVRKFGDEKILRQLIGLFSVAALLIFVASCSFAVGIDLHLANPSAFLSDCGSEWCIVPNRSKPCIGKCEAKPCNRSWFAKQPANYCEQPIKRTSSSDGKPSSNGYGRGNRHLYGWLVDGLHSVES